MHYYNLCGIKIWVTTTIHSTRSSYSTDNSQNSTQRFPHIFKLVLYGNLEKEVLRLPQGVCIHVHMQNNKTIDNDHTYPSMHAVSICLVMILLTNKVID